MAKQDKQTGEIQNPYPCDFKGVTNLVEGVQQIACNKAWNEGYDAARSSVAQEIFKELENIFQLQETVLLGDALRGKHYPERTYVLNPLQYEIVKARYIKGDTK